jgi:hypothetical protein
MVSKKKKPVFFLIDILDLIITLKKGMASTPDDFELDQIII